MKYRLRFVIVHTFVVASILFFAMLSIYLVSANARRTTYDQRLYTQAAEHFISFYHIDTLHEKFRYDITPYPSTPFSNASIKILNDSGRLVFTQTVGAVKKVVYPNLSQIKQSKEFFFRYGDSDCVGVYIKNRHANAYVIISAYDKFGLIRLAQLRFIMIIVTFITIIVTGLFSFFYIVYITQPLIKLSLQMQKLSEKNLKENFNVRKSLLKNNELAHIVVNFNDMRERLDKAFEMQKSFVHHASHELRTPLSVMLAQTESALRGELTLDKSRAVLQSLKEDQQEMIELTNSLLLLSQYEQPDFSLDWKIVRLDEVLYEAIEMIKKMVSNISISIEFDNPPEDELNLSVPGNETLLRSAFRNLIKNAYQYSDDRSVSINICFTQTSINIHFNNKGKLISEKEQPQLFIPFFRSINSRHKKGFGLGLTIVQRIIKLHNGTIHYSIYNNDTNRFTVSFSTQGLV